MKPIIALLAAVIMTVSPSLAQEWIGSKFALDTILELNYKGMPKNMNRLKCQFSDSTFRFVEQLAFQKSDYERDAVIYELSMSDYAQREVRIPHPHNNKDNPKTKHELWIYDFCFHGDRLLVTTQHELLLYKKDIRGNYGLESIFGDRKNLCMAYISHNKINYFEEDHDKGYQWFQQDLSGGSEVLVREIPYEAPHIVQIQPNRHIFHNQTHVFFLSTRYPRLEVYTLDGDPVDTVRFNIPNWKAFEDEYIRKTLEVPYGIERIYAVKDDLFSYSYPRVALPFGDDLVLFFTHYDTSIGKSVLQYAILNHEKQLSFYGRSNHEDSMYVAAQFPFDLFLGGFDKGFASNRNILVQLTYKTDVTWTNKTASEYRNDVNRYYNDNPLRPAFKIMRYRPEQGGKATFNQNSSETKSDYNCNSKTNTTVGTNRGENCAATNRNLYVVHGGLECSGCAKALYLLIDSKVSGNETKITQLFANELVGVRRLEITEEIRQYLTKSFSIKSFDDVPQLKNNLNNFSTFDYPAVILEVGESERKVFRLSEIFTEDNTVSDFRKDFVERLELFLGKQP